MHTAIDRIVEAFEKLTPARVESLDTLYAPDARFKDPFNDVQGVPAIQQIFRHMYETLEDPRFVITGRIVQGAQCFLTWEFRFCFRRFKPGQAQCIVGGSHLVLNPDGRIALHRDYWDAAEELYEKLPLIGNLLRWLKPSTPSRP
jgi:limonene-1,2-epoxide hydrolase